MDKKGVTVQFDLKVYYGRSNPYTWWYMWARNDTKYQIQMEIRYFNFEFFRWYIENSEVIRSPDCLISCEIRWLYFSSISHPKKLPNIFIWCLWYTSYRTLETNTIYWKWYIINVSPMSLYAKSSYATLLYRNWFKTETVGINQSYEVDQYGPNDNEGISQLRSFLSWRIVDVSQITDCVGPNFDRE